MSLKAVHLVFVNVLSALCLGFGVWKLRDYFTLGGGTNLAFGAGGVVATVVVVIYGIYFLRKLKSISYL